MFGLLVLAGAWIDPDALAQLLPAARQIGLRTAAGFIVAGVAVSVIGSDKAARPVGLAAGLILFLLAGIGLLALLAGAPDAGYGRSLLEYLPAGGQLAAWPGRMSLPTAIAFGLCGLALLQRPGAGAVAVAVAVQVIIGAVILLGAGGMLMHASGLASLYQLVPNMAVMSWPTGTGFILLGLGLLIHGVNAPWFRTYYAGREDRRVFAAGIAILLALVLTGWSVGVGQFARQSVAAAQRALQESLRINAVLADDALEAAAANAGQILALSRLEELLAVGGGTRPAVQAELERIMRSARTTGVRSIHVLAPDGNIVAQSGLAALPALLEAPLGMAGEHRLRWSNDWSLAARIGLARGNRSLGSAVVEIGLPALEKIFATVRHASASREFLLCAQASGEPQCFPSHIQPGITRLPPRPDGRPWPAALALRGEQGMTVFSDPQGFNVMAAYAPVAKTGLGAVGKVHINDLFGPLRRELLYAFMMLMALCIGGSFVLYWLVTPVMRRIVRLQADMGAVLANVPTGIVWIDQQRRILGANPAVERMFGYTHDELAGRDLAELVPALTPTVVDETAAGGQPPRVSHGRRRDGGALRIEFALTDYAIEGEKRFACIVQDVGEREQAIEKLRYWGLIFERARWGVVIGNANAGVIDTMNPEFARMHGYTVEELTGRPIVDVFAPEVRAEVPEFLRRVHEFGHYQYESLHVRKDGTVFPVFIDATTVRDEHGQVQFRVVNVQDITERKQAEIALQRSEANLHRAQAVAQIGSWYLDISSNRLEWSDETFRIFGIPKKEAIDLDTFISILHPDDRETMFKAWNEAVAGAAYDIEHRIVTNGETRWVRERAEIERDAQGRPLFGVGTTQDITERKSQEEALRRSESLLRKVLETLPVGVWIADRNGQIIQGNEAGQRIWRGSRYVSLDGYGEYEGWWATTGKKIEPKEWALARAITHGETSLGEVVHIRCFDGSHKTILNSGIPLLGSDGAVEGAIVVNEDITERQRADEELRVSKSLFQTTFDFASVGIALCDLEGRFLLVNQAFCATVGFAEQELLTRSFHDITHPEDLPPNLAESRRLLAGGINAYQLEKRYLHKHGQTVWALLSVALVHDKENAPVYFIGQITDITQRKHVEEELVRSREQLRELAAYSDNVREVERKRIAREVHDELGQQLTVLRMSLSFLLQQHDEDPEMTGQMTEMRLLVDRMVGVVRHVASNLRPAPLDLGIVPALEWLAEDFEQHSGIRCRIHMPDVTENFNDALMLDDVRATAVFRIVQESLTNVARHSGADQVTISLEEESNSIALRVEDNGNGFDLTIANTGRSFGLLGMRERILILQGELQINSAPGKGTVVAFKLPVNRRERTRNIGNGVQEE